MNDQENWGEVLIIPADFYVAAIKHFATFSPPPYAAHSGRVGLGPGVLGLPNQVVLFFAPLQLTIALQKMPLLKAWRTSSFGKNRAFSWP